ncbi:NAD-P-binding protein [Lactarius pseudohatsudake]|nr:NAD-P-binding protein [Lactarius pseudohatsudake]
MRFLTLDVTSPMVEIKRCVDEALAIWGHIDVIVNNAEGLTYGLSEELSAEGFVNDMNTNFFGPINVTNAALPSMHVWRDGIIVFIGSCSTYERQTTGVVSHCASKAALRSYAETLSIELETFEIRVIFTLPGGFATKFNALTQSGTPLAGYEALHDQLDSFVQNYAKIPKDDPDLGMSTLINVVRGEGRAAGREMLPLWLFLGDDSMRDVCMQMYILQAELEEWEDVGSNLGLLQEQISA